MTSDGRPDAALDRLAEQHADLVDDHTHGPGRRAAIEAADPDAGPVFAALDRTRADLAAAPAPPAPPGLLADLDRALAAERARPARPGGRRRLLAVAALVALLALLTGALVAGAVVAGHPAPVAQPARPELPMVHRGDLPQALRTGLGSGPVPDGGLLADPDRLAACLAAHDLPAGTHPAGARRVLLDGTPGVLFVLPTGVAARFRLLVVGDGCSPETPLTLADGVVGR